MSLNKTLLALALGLALSAVSCRKVEQPVEPSKDVVVAGEIEVSNNIVLGVSRIYDTKYRIVCYKYYATAFSCVKMP